jgi:hypothetical protein
MWPYVFLGSPGRFAGGSLIGLQLRHLLVNPSSAALLSSSGVKMLHIRKYCCNFADETFQAIIFDTRRRQSGVLWLLL